MRKSGHQLRRLSLNYISDRELKDKKVEYPTNTNIRTFPYVDWTRFISYNLKDVLLQFGIEKKTNDTFVYFKRYFDNLTPYSKIFRETHLLRNARELYFEEDGWVQSNNVNIIKLNDIGSNKFLQYDDEPDDIDEETVLERSTSFKGAIVADPANNDNVGELLLGIKSNIIFRNCFDMDMEAFYPSIKIAFNIDSSTLICKAYISTQKYIDGKYINRSLNTVYVELDKNKVERLNDITGECINTYVSGNTLSFAYNWLSTLSISDLYNELMKVKNRVQ